MPLTTATAIPIIAVRDLDTASRFYDEVLGLELESDRGMVQVWHSGGSKVMLSLHEGGSKAEHAVAGWLVEDIDATVADLKERGVQFEDFGMPAQDGVVSFGDDRVAYFRDPDGNLLSVSQLA